MTRAVRTFRAVRVSFLLRVDSEQLASGRLAGEIEEVMTGAVAGVRSAADILAFCVRAAGCEQGTGAGSPAGE